MITRLNGRYSTLAANPAPRRRRATKRNPSALEKALAAQERANKRAQKLKDRIAELEAKAKAKARRDREKAKEAKEKERKKARRALTRKTKAARTTERAKRRAAASKTYKVSPPGRKPYRMRKLPFGTKAVEYVYSMRKRVGTTKSGKPKYETKYISRKAPGNTKPPFTIIKDGNTYKLHKNPRRRKNAMKRKNAGLVVAGVPVVEMAIGSVAAIGVGALSEALIKKYAGKSVPAQLQDIVGELATVGIAAFAHGRVKNKMAKDVIQYAFVGAVFSIINNLAREPIVNSIQKALPTGGTYFDPSAVGGLYMDPMGGDGAVGGMYLNDQTAAPAMGAMHSHGHSMSGLGLFEGRSIYG